MEAEVLQGEARAEIERKQRGLELRRRQRELVPQQFQVQKKMAVKPQKGSYGVGRIETPTRFVSEKEKTGDR